MNPFDKKFEKPLEKPIEPVPVIEQKVQEVKKVEKEVVQAPQQNILVSDLDSFVIDRLRSQPQTLTDVEARVLEKPKDGSHRLSLPEELKEYEKKYAFCWIYKKKRAIDEACDIYQWVLCNKTYFPDVAEKASHLFTARGVIERGDEILAFRTIAVDQEMRKAPGLESTARIKSRTEAHQGDATYYIPDAEYERQPDGTMKQIPVVGV